MDALTLYYVRQAGYGRIGDAIGPVYTSSPFVQRGHGIGSFLGGLFRAVRPFLLSGAKTLGRETLRTGGKILTDIADNTTPGVGVKDIISRNVHDSTQKLFHKLRGRGMKCKRAPMKKKRTKRARGINTDIFS